MSMGRKRYHCVGNWTTDLVLTSHPTAWQCTCVTKKTKRSSTLVQTWVGDDLLKKIDAYAEKLMKEQPGTRIGRSVVLRILVYKALEKMT